MQKTTKKEKEECIQNQFSLINGVFSASDANNILSHLISEKINFHQLRNLSNEIRFGITDKNSLNRIAELNQSKEAINLLFAQAKDSGKSLRVESNLVIEIV